VADETNGNGLTPNPGESWQDFAERVREDERAKGADSEGDTTTFEGVIGGTVPKVDKAPESREDAAELGKMFAEYRAEVAALRKELQAHRPRQVQVAATTETPEQRHEARLEAIADSSHYCPGCGALGKYAQKCTGPAGSGHPPIEMVTTDELGGDPEKHTPAPSTDPDQPDLVAA